jgi:hypothetical protein
MIRLNRAGTMILSGLEAFGGFWYRFIFGDDWTIAATVGVALVVTWLLRTAGVAAWWLPPLAAVAVVGTSLRRVNRRTATGERASTTKPSAGNSPLAGSLPR